MSEKDLCFYNWNLTKTFNHNQKEHIELPSNLLQKYRYINLNNPSFYDLHLFTADPDSGSFVQPFLIIPQNSLLSFEIPTEMTHNGLFILPIYNPNNSVKYEKRAFIQFSQNNDRWDEIGKENNNINLYELQKISPANAFTILEENTLKTILTGDEYIPIANVIHTATTMSQLFKISGYIENLVKTDILLTMGGDIIKYMEAGYFEQIVKIQGSANNYSISIFNEGAESEYLFIKNFKVEVL